jgi:hypothetical protein
MQITPIATSPAARFVEGLRDPRGRIISPKRFADELTLTAGRLAELAQVHRSTLTRAPESEKLQTFLRDAAGVLALAIDATGGDEDRAIYWFRSVPLLDLGAKTAEQLVAEGHADGVRDYLINLAAGATG